MLQWQHSIPRSQHKSLLGAFNAFRTGREKGFRLFVRFLAFITLLAMGALALCEVQSVDLQAVIPDKVCNGQERRTYPPG